MKSMTIRVAIVALLYVTVAIGHVLAATPAAVADRTIIADGGAAKTLDEAWQVTPDAHLQINNIRGRVQIRGWDRAVVDLQGRLGSGSRLEISGSKSNLSLRVKSNENGWFGNSGPKHDSTLVLQIPRDSVLELNVISADVDVSGIAGKSTQVEGVSGDLVLSSGARDVEVTSVSGDVQLSVTGKAMHRAHVQTVSGDVKATNLRGHVKLETVSGNIQAQAGQISDLETGSVSGDATISTALTDQARVHMESMSGDVNLTLPSGLSARIEASTFSGDIRSDFGKPQTSEHGPGSHLNTQVGDGNAQLDLQTFSGDISLHRSGE